VLPYQKCYKSRAPVAHPIILATEEAEIKEDHGLKPAWENSSKDPISKKKKN
jgi:hypothetical protein